MKYYVIEISTGSESVAGRAVYEYDSKNGAIASFHKKLGTAMASDLYTSELILVIDENGAMYKEEHYVAETASDAQTESGNE